MTVATAENTSVKRFLSAIGSKDVLTKLSWQEWLDIPAPYAKVKFTKQPIQTRFQRNGYDWDIHGQVYTPEKEVDPNYAFVIGVGTNGSEGEADQTPDGRPGLAQHVAMQGFKVLTYTFPGHYSPPDGLWKEPIPERLPKYVYDRKIPEAELKDRLLKCTFDTNIMGLAQLIDANLAGRKLIGCNGTHMTRLPKFLRKATVVGIASMGFGGPDRWRLEWRDKYGHETEESQSFPIDEIERKSIQYFKNMGYESDEDICPWGAADGYIAKVSRWRSQMKSSLTVNQHAAATNVLEEYVRRSGLSREEIFGYLDQPDENWMRGIGVLLLVGENDQHHWDRKHEGHSREWFMARKYREFTDRSHVVMVPRHGHIGFSELHNENFTYYWLWAFKNKYFG
jgi:hypothetical protein